MIHGLIEKIICKLINNESTTTREIRTDCDSTVGWCIFRGAPERSTSLLDPGCVQSVQSRDWGESTRNISTWVQLCLSSVTLFENFYSSFSTGRTENGKLPELVSEEDTHSGGNCAKIARLVNASSPQPLFDVVTVQSVASSFSQLAVASQW